MKSVMEMSSSDNTAGMNACVDKIMHMRKFPFALIVVLVLCAAFAFGAYSYTVASEWNSLANTSVLVNHLKPDRIIETDRGYTIYIGKDEDIQTYQVRTVRFLGRHEKSNEDILTVNFSKTAKKIKTDYTPEQVTFTLPYKNLMTEDEASQSRLVY